MDSKKSASKDQNFVSNYEEDNEDSDIESRLYAEIHYTNNIIGDESNFVDNHIDDSLGNKSTSEDNFETSKFQSQSKLQTSQSSNHALRPQKVPNSSVQNNPGISTIMSSAHKNPVQLQSSNSNSKKRSLPRDSHQDESNKKKKTQQNNTDNVSDRNRMINPYHKNVNNQQYGMKLLSPAFLHLFFGKSKNKKKKAAQNKLNSPAQPVKVSISYDTPALSTPEENVLQNSVENQVIQKEAEVSGVQDSEAVIDICSESSEDYIENNSKYNNIEATDKKLTKQNSMVNNENSEDDTSDSDESIFEVPIPPKPAPPVIELNDSDNENEENSDDSDSSNDFHDSNQVNSQNTNRAVSNITENLEDQENSDSESSESNNLILNCTEVQRGVSSISDIKRMRQETSSKITSANETNITNVPNNPKNDSEVLNNSVSRENTTSTKEANSSVTKQTSKSPRPKGSRHIVKEKSFFQPMSAKMKSFYNDSWGGENFDLEMLKCNMPRDPKKWAILDDDRMVSFARRKRYFGMACSRCQKEGHRQNQCPEQYKLPTCHMCGKKGHFETGCPDKKCLTCGKKQNMYRRTCEQCIKMVCTRCKARGHMEHFCPDLWRSYHQTVNNTTPNVPKNTKTVMKPQHSLYCCNCAKKGHDFQSCKKLRWSEHFPVPSHVISYSGPEYSKENFGTESNLSSSNSFCEDSLTPRNSSNKTTHRNLAYDNSPKFSRNQILDPDRNVIFRVKSKTPIENEVFKFILKIPNKKVPSEYNYWNGLSAFLYEVVNELSGEFLLCKNNQNVVMEMRVPRKTRVSLEKLIQQYAGRNNFERSYMYLSFDRNPDRLIQHLTNKLKEIQNSTFPKNILELYDELMSLKSNENEQQRASTFANQKLIVCLKKLLLALYKEGCADNSLSKLKKILNSNKVKQGLRHSKKVPKKLRQDHLTEAKLTLKVVFECLLYYNNVFVPYEPRQLDSYIGTYKKNLERCEKLLNNPLIFPQCNNKKATSNTQNSSFSSTVTTENVLTSSTTTSCQIPSLLLINTSTTSQIQPTVSQIQPTVSQIRPLVSHIQTTESQVRPGVSNIQPALSQMEPAITSNIVTPLLSINTSISSNFQFSQNVPAVAGKAKPTPKKKKRQVNNYNRFLKKTTKLIEKAHQLDNTHARKYAEILENKIKNGIYLFAKDSATLRFLMKEDR